MESLFVTVDVLIVEVGVLVVPHTELQRLPTTFLVDNDLATLEFRFIPIRNATYAPNGSLGFKATKVRPENASGLSEVGGLKEVFGVNHRNVIRIEQEDFLERTMQDGEWLQFPAVENARRVSVADWERINALDT
jgi:hypothetical protein